MPWFKVDDNLAFHPKAVAAGNAAMGLWVRAGAYCATHLTDGYVPKALLSTLGGRPRDAAKLVEAGLWDAVSARDQPEISHRSATDRPEIGHGTDGSGRQTSAKLHGWRFRNWAEFQPTKTQVEQERRATAERVKAWREKRGNGVTNGVGNDVGNDVGTPAPTRPDPTRIKDKDKEPSAVADATPPRPDVEALCKHLADQIEANGSKRPTVNKTWRDAARLLLDQDGHTEEQIRRAIDWCQSDEFWRTNIMSMKKLREKYDTLRLQAQSKRPTQRRNTSDRVQDGLNLARELAAEYADTPPQIGA